MSLSLARPIFLSLAVALAPLGALAEAPADLRTRIENSGGVIQLRHRQLDVTGLRDFYRQRNYQPAWTGQADRLLAEARDIARAEGLDPRAYAVGGTDSPDRDLLVSDALARLGHDLAAGRVAPVRPYGGMGPDSRPAFEATPFLNAVAAGGAVTSAVAPLAPQFAGYQRLKQAHARFKAIVEAGGWPAIADGPSIKPGDADPRLPQIRARLIAAGLLDPLHAKGQTLDEPVIAALKEIQRRHGLDMDGSVGKQTLAALNVPAARRLAQIEMNLERWRWMPRRLDDVHVAVNLPAARLELVDKGEVTMAMRVVVGDVKHPTPAMTTTMSSVVLNPTWTIPPSIASREILPKLRKDPNYLAANNIRILDAFPEDSPMASGQGVNWHAVRGSRFPYRLRQKPGPDNALGYVKFNLKDSDDIYLHDTPNRTAFGRTFRALSHGCVRVERPLELAEALLGDQWEGKVDDTILAAETRTLKLERSVSVYLMYFTAWADGAGVVHFRDDLYGHDGRLKAALERSRPKPDPDQVAEDQPRTSL